MLKQHFPNVLAGLTVSLMIVGCGGGEDRERSSTVITPPAAKAPVDDEVAATTPAAEPAPEEPKPEMKNEEPAPSTEVAAAKPAEETPAAEANPAEEEASAEAADTDKGTTFKGRVTVTGGTPTVNPIIPGGNDAYCVALKSIPNDAVVVGEDNGLAGVFVWVRKLPKGVDAPPAPTEPAVLDQKNCRFIPHTLIVQVGQTLLVKNDDDTLHNTRMSGLAINFNQTVSPNNREGVPVEINKAEIVPVPVKCDIHAWMSARVLTTDNPWSAITDENGNFEINNLPADVELEFRLQHGIAGYVEKSLKLTLADGEVKEQDFEVDASKLQE